jgi:magnesium transporter
MRRSGKRPVEPGLPPGLFTDVEAGVPVRVRVIDYTADNLTVSEGGPITPAPGGVSRWIRITGIPDRMTLEQLHEQLGVHPLVLEDVISRGTRIKTEDYETFAFTVLLVTESSPHGQTAESELDLLLFADTLVTIAHADDQALVDPIQRRLSRTDSYIRQGTVDRLYYAFLDLVVDLLYPHVSRVEDEMDAIEAEMAESLSREHLRRIQGLRSAAQRLRSIAWATRDVVAHDERAGEEWFSESTRFFFRDVHDHILHILDTLGELKESASVLMEYYRSEVNNKINEVMKVLTIISTVFIPITFIAGIYGMNFVNMPELGFKWAYPVVIGLMLAIAGGMLVFFKRRKWF